MCEFLPSPLTRAESDALIDRIEQGFELLGFGLWAVEVPGATPCIGYVGLSMPGFTAHFTPAVEVGWRLDALHWGRGYATEAAREALRFAFEEVELDEVVSFTVRDNHRSRAVMERLGMTNDPSDDFDHPRLPEGDRLRPHVLYRARSAEWASGPPRRGSVSP